MKKNVQAGLIASLLLAPGIVAQANHEIPVPIEQATTGDVAIPFNTVAALTEAEQIAQFTAANEHISASELTLLQSRLASANLINPDMLTLIEAKLQYIEDMHAFTSQATNLAARISGLALTSGTLIKDTESAVTTYEALLDDVIVAEETLAEAASGVTEAALVLGSLLYYGGNGPVDFLYETIGTTTINTLESREEAIVEPSEFMASYMTPLVAAMAAETIDPAVYSAELDEAKTAYNELTAGAKAIVKVQLINGKKVEAVLAEATADFTKAAAVEAKVAEMLAATFTSPSTFQSKMNDVIKSHNALTATQKALVPNWDDVADYNQVMTITTAIDAVQVGLAGYRDELAAIEAQYIALGQIPTIGAKLQSYVVNYSKFAGLQAAAAEAAAVEMLINGITVENAPTEIPKASAAYKALSTTTKKHVSAEDVTTLTTWEKYSSTAAVVIKNIQAIVVEKSDFISKTNTASASWSKIAAEPPTREQQLVVNSARLLSLMPYAEVANQVNNLAMSNATYLMDLQAAQAALTNWPTAVAGLTAADQAQLAVLKTKLTQQVTALQNETTIAQQIESDLASFVSNPDTVDLLKLAELRATYNKLSASAKTLVTNAASLAELENQYKVALDIVASINAIDFRQRDFPRRVLSVKAAYDTITPSSLKPLVANAAVLEEYVPIAQVMIQIDALRVTSPDFRDEVASARMAYNQLAGSIVVAGEPTTAQERLVKEYLPKLISVEYNMKRADQVIANIESLQEIIGQPFMKLLTDTKEMYAALTAIEKKLVTNANDLKTLDRDYRSALKVFNLIEKLPVKTDKNYPKRVVAAEKAYQKLSDKQKSYVYNYNEKLAGFLEIADLIGRIDKLKIGSKTYEADVAELKAIYNTLMEASKALIHNYPKLVEAEENMSEAEVVEKLIDEVDSAGEEYLEKLAIAREAYDALDKNKRKLVSNYKDLTTRERAVKPILKLDDQMAKLDTANAKKFISSYRSAQKAYEKLDANEKALLANEELFMQELKPLYDVMSLIAAIKPSSKTFVADTKKARDLYEALLAEQKAKISNYELLLGLEINVEGGASVDELILAIDQSDPKERIAAVKEARAAYNALDSKNRRGVTLVNELKAHEKYIKPVEQTMALIEGLTNPRNKLSAQVEKVNRAFEKLNAEQTSFITNMSDYMDLSEVVKVYQLIDKLQPSDKYYLGNLQAAKAAYNKLSAQEKHRVTNYSELQAAEMSVADIQKVYNLIAGLSPRLDSYEADVLAAEEALKEMPAGLRKQVTNTDDLKDARKNLKAVQSVMSKIEKIDPNARSFESKTSAAKKAYDKLMDEQKKLVRNYTILHGYETELGLR